MTELTKLIEQAMSLLNQQQPEVALQVLQESGPQYSEDVQFLQIFGELLLENSDLENAYEILSKSCELDPEGQHGVEKFLYLGQIIGGEDGLNLLNTGLNKLQDELTSASDKAPIIKKLNQGIFAEIEIWMTDLCMEPEAESKCDELIKLSIELDDQNLELWSLLASIRISQQLKQELIELCTKSWDLFNKRKQVLELNQDDNDLNFEYIELIQPLLTLCKYSIELGLFETALDIASTIQDINDTCLESYYLEGFVNYILIKKSQNQLGDDIDIGSILPELPEINKSDPSIEDTLLQLRLLFTNGLKVVPSLNTEEIDNELISQIKNLLIECGGKLSNKELKLLEKIDNSNWELEIESD